MYGVIDIGSNTIRLALYKIIDNKIEMMLNKKYTAGLAQYIKKQHLEPRGIKTAVDVLNEYNLILEHIRVKRLYIFATAVFRNIDNTEEVLAEIKEKCGLKIQILTGDEEAAYDYYGAVQNSDLTDGLLVDIGGGSTELVVYENKKIIHTASIPAGSLTTYNSFVKNIIPDVSEIEEIKKFVNSELERISLPELKSDIICGVGGSIRASLKVLKELHEDIKNEYDISALDEIFSMIQTDKREITSLILAAAPERIHTLICGITILKTVAEHFGSKNVIVSKSGVREGFLCYQLEQKGVISCCRK
ncbi:MAG: hypothetical protein Q4Q53_02370 [Methanocorpusculum sp.]|nr:hypothetical protein [Methanocorpusculum sp.]